MYKQSFPTMTQNCFIQAWLLSAVPCTSQQLVCLLQLMYNVISEMFAIVSGQLQAELNQCQA